MFYKVFMKLNEAQLNEIKKVCESIDYGSVTIKLNKELKFVDIVAERRIRLQSLPTTNNAPAGNGRY